MSINAINGSVIGKTSFPGAESGLTLVQLVATIHVVGSINSYRVDHAIAPQTQGRAVCSAELNFVRYLAFTSSGQALTSATCENRVPVIVSATPTASTAATFKIRILIDPTVQAVASTTAEIKNRARMYPAALTGRATTSATALVRVFMGFSETAEAVGTAEALIWHYLYPEAAYGVATVSEPTIRMHIGMTLDELQALADCSATAYDYSISAAADTVLVVPAEDRTLRVPE